MKNHKLNSVKFMILMKTNRNAKFVKIHLLCIIIIVIQVKFRIVKFMMKMVIVKPVILISNF